MTEELNISEILKSKSKGTKLYSPIFGDCTFSFIQGVTDAICVIANDTREFFDYKGLYSPTGERQLFPSKEMCNWFKFQWKKGDVLVSNDGGTEVIFDKWYDDTYTSFYGKHYLNSEDENNIKYNEAFLCTTERYSLEDKDSAQTYINTIEERFGGKLNRETLKIEKAQSFKDGDVITIMPHIGDRLIYLFKAEDDEKYYGHAFLDGNIAIVNEDSYCQKDFCTARPSIEAEKQQLFSALAKEGKAWDDKKKQIVSLKPKVELKPFDKVLVRDFENQAWATSFFGFKDADLYFCCNGRSYQQCIPYIGNEHLLGTTKDVKG